MKLKINYLNKIKNTGPINLALFVNEKFDLREIKKYFNNQEYNYINQILKKKHKQSIITFDLNSKKSLILIKKDRNFTPENLGAEFYDFIKKK